MYLRQKRDRQCISGRRVTDKVSPSSRVTDKVSPASRETDNVSQAEE